MNRNRLCLGTHSVRVARSVRIRTYTDEDFACDWIQIVQRSGCNRVGADHGISHAHILRRREKMEFIISNQVISNTLTSNVNEYGDE